MSDSSERPAVPRYFEEYAAGQQREFGTVSFSEPEIIAFARRFDPQVFHTDPEAARRSIYGGLIASGWQTGTEMMRLLVENHMRYTENLGSPGMDELRWPRPVRPGDTLSVRMTVLDTRRSTSKPDRGAVRISVEALNQRREVVMSLTMVFLVRCRPAA